MVKYNSVTCIKLLKPGPSNLLPGETRGASSSCNESGSSTSADLRDLGVGVGSRSGRSGSGQQCR